MHCVKIVPFVIVIIALTGCGASQPPSEKPRSGALPPAYLAAEYARDLARIARPDTRVERGLDVESYSLRGRFDWTTLKLVASVTVRVKLLAGEPKEILLDSGVQVSRVMADDGKELSFKVEKGLLRIDISRLRPKRDQTIAVDIAYETPANVTISGEQSALVATASRKGDPVEGRTVATLSEPLGAAEWLPCHNTPSDRALFSTELTMPESERFISNGDLLLEETANGERRMRYATRYGLPTYLMALAIGDFVTTTQYHRDIPVSIWRRRGLPIDAGGMLTALRRMMAHFESLLVPYPFEKYSLVLLPDYSGGLEHAGITFQGEISSTQSLMHGDLGLTAHELGHQWFGDLMTIATWDDLWIKEGMATLLAEESSRPHEDQNGSGRLYGRAFTPRGGEAIRDTALEPNEKYTSGPYSRAAWFFTQVRALLGEKKFWAILADTLNRHRFGVIGTDAFLEGFRADLGDAQIARLKTALAAKAIPGLVVSRADGKVTATVSDKEGALLVPVEARWYRADGTFETVQLSSEKSAALPAPDGGFLVLDPKDVHPTRAFAGKKFDGEVLPLLVPYTESARRTIAALGAGAQTDLFQASAPWKIEPKEMDALYAVLASEDAKFQALQIACEVASRAGAKEALAAWKAVVTARLLDPPWLGMRGRGLEEGLSPCRAVVGDALFEGRFRAVAERPEGIVHEPELHFLAALSTRPSLAFEAGRALVERGRSVRSREIGIEMLGRHLAGEGKFEPPSKEEEPTWKALFHKVIISYETVEIQQAAITTIVQIKDKEAIPPLATAVLTARYPRLQRVQVCAAAQLAKEDAPAWQKFVGLLGDLSRLPEATRALVADPKKCKKDE